MHLSFDLLHRALVLVPLTLHDVADANLQLAFELLLLLAQFILQLLISLQHLHLLFSLAKELLVGKETTIVGRLSKAEGRMGRSLVIDLPTQGYRQVDHRTLKHLIIDNVKHTIKK